MRKIIHVDMESSETDTGTADQIFARYSDVVERVSTTEAYLDISECPLFGGSATLIARDLFRALKDELHAHASVGAAPNKFLARIASGRCGPDGPVTVRATEVADFVADLPVEQIWGVGRRTARKMRELGLHTCADLRATPTWQLKGWLGTRAGELADLARGHDERPVEPGGERKSLSVEETFANDLTTLAECLAEVPGLYFEFEERVRAADVVERIRGVFVKVTFHDHRSTTHEMPSRAVPRIVDFEALVARAYARREEPVRLIGLGVRLTPAEAPAAAREQLSFSLEPG